MRNVRPLRALLTLGVLLAPALAAAATIPPGQEELVADMLGRGVHIGECRWDGASIAPTMIVATYACPGAKVVVELRATTAAPADAPRTKLFAIVVREGTPPPALVPELAARVRDREASFRWEAPQQPRADTRPPPPAPVWPYALIPITLTIAAVAAIVAGARGKTRRSVTPARRGELVVATIALPFLLYGALQLAASSVAAAIVARPAAGVLLRLLGSLVMLFFATLPASVVARAPSRGRIFGALLAVSTLYAAYGYSRTLARARSESARFDRLYVPEPNQSYANVTTTTRAVFRTNEYGFREPSFTLARDPARPRIVLIGDSHVFGVGVGLPDTLAAKLGDELRTRWPNTNFEVLNLGIPGNNIESHVTVYDVATTKLAPDVVVMCVSLPNDASLWDFQKERAAATRVSVYSFARFVLGAAAPVLYDHMLLKRTMDEPGKQFFRAQSERLAALRARGPAPMLVVLAYLDLTEELTTTLGAVPGTTLVPTGEARAGEVIPGDGHPTGAGNQRFARLLAEHLASREPFTRLLATP